MHETTMCGYLASKTRRICVPGAILTLLWLVQGIDCTRNHTNLMSALFVNYSRDLRPECDLGEVVNVKIGIALRQILDLDEPKQILESSIWFRLAWNDCNIGWEPDDYGGVESIIIPAMKLWLPDITLYESAGQSLTGTMQAYTTVVYYDGNITLNFPMVMKTICRIDIKYFPFDDQNCSLMLGSWAYHGHELNVLKRIEAGDNASYIPSGEWELLGIPSRRHSIIYGCCPEPYPDVTFYIILHRLPLFYIINLLFPCALISMISMLTFWLPPDSGEKVSLGITVLLSLTVFLLIVSESMPATSEIVPLIGQYFAATIILVSLSCLMTVVVLNAHFKGKNGKPVPRWMRKYILVGLARILFMTPINNSQRFTKKHNTRYHPDGATHAWSSPVRNGESISRVATMQNGDINMLIPDINMLSPETIETINPGTKRDELTGHMVATTALLKGFHDRLVENDEEERLMSDWKRVAMVFDRLFLSIYVAIAISVTLAIFMQAIGQY